MRNMHGVLAAVATGMALVMSLGLDSAVVAQAPSHSSPPSGISGPALPVASPEEVVYEALED